MSILLLGAYHKKTGVYTLPTKAIKTEEYSCPDCKKDLILCQGDIRVHYFRHIANDIRPCTYYDKPSESQIHHSAKLLLKELLLHSSVIICRSCPSCKTFEQYDIPICTDGSSISIEHRFEYNGLKIADVAYLHHNEIVGIFEIYHTHKTDATNRPEPWFEIEATSLLSFEPDSIIKCMRNVVCDTCVEQNKIITKNETIARLQQLLQISPILRKDTDDDADTYHNMRKYAQFDKKIVSIYEQKKFVKHDIPYILENQIISLIQPFTKTILKRSLVNRLTYYKGKWKKSVPFELIAQWYHATLQTATEIEQMISSMM